MAMDGLDPPLTPNRLEYIGLILCGDTEPEFLFFTIKAGLFVIFYLYPVAWGPKGHGSGFAAAPSGQRRAFIHFLTTS